MASGAELREGAEILVRCRVRKTYDSSGVVTLSLGPHTPTIIRRNRMVASG
jgi:hypothetical protein